MPKRPASHANAGYLTRQDLAALVALVGLLLAYRLLTLPPIEVHWDAAVRWYWSKNIVQILTRTEWNHQSARVAITLVTGSFRGVFGTHPTVYYIAPLFMSAVQVVFVFLLCRRAAGVTAAVLACLGLILYPQMLRNGTQLWPGVFSGTFVIGTVYFVSRCFTPRIGEVRTNITLAALIFLAAYLSKLPNLFFLPVLTLAVWNIRRDRADVIRFLAPLAVLVALEWAFYALYVGGYDLGRLSVIQGHLDRVAQNLANRHLHDLSALGWADLFLLRYSVHWLGGYTLAITFYVASAAAAILLFLNRRADNNASLSAYGILTFAFLTAIAVKDLDPLTPVQPFIARYLAVIAPLMMIVIAVLAARVGAQAGRLVEASHGPRGGRVVAVAVTIAGLSPMLVSFAVSNWPAHVTAYARHPFVVLGRYQDLVDRATVTCMPLVYPDRWVLLHTRWTYFDRLSPIYEILVRRGQIHALGFAARCRSRYPDLAAYLAARGDASDAPAIMVSIKLSRRRKHLDFREARLPLDMLTRHVGPTMPAAHE